MKNFAMKLADAVKSDKDLGAMKQSRRIWLQNLGLVGASGAVMWACGGSDDKAVAGCAVDYKNDAGILNAALALEHEAISIYTQAAGLSVWNGSADSIASATGTALKEIAVGFAGHHTAHRDALIAAITDLKTKQATGIDPVEALDDADYLSSTTAATLTSIKAVFRVAAAKEAAAAKAYFGAVAAFTDSDLRVTSGLLGGDEAAHYGAIRAALFAVLGDTDVETDMILGGGALGTFAD